jgi:hypothetical protein
MTLEAVIAEMNGNLVKNNALLEQLIAGRAEAVTALAAASAKGATRGGKKDDKVTPPADTKAAPPTKPTISDDTIRDLAGGWLKATDDKTERAVRSDFVKSLLAHFGTKTLVGPEGIQDADARAQAVFFLKRKIAGCAVDFGADYDFDGEPNQGGEPEAEEDLMG